MVLGVWDSHTRLLLPSEETLPPSWESRGDAIGAIVYRKWGDWRVAPVADATRVSFDFAHCRICARKVRIPVSEVARYDGLTQQRWRRRNPCPHTTEPGAQPREIFGESAPGSETRAQIYGGCCLRASGTLGCKVLPDCDHMWRTAGPCAEEVSSYASAMGETFSESQFCSLAHQGGDKIVRQGGCLYPALANVLECEMRYYVGQIGSPHGNEMLFQAKYPAIVEILIHVVRAVYDRWGGVTPRIRGLSYNLSPPD